MKPRWNSVKHIIIGSDDESDAESSSIDGIGYGLGRMVGDPFSRAGVMERPRTEGEVRMGGGGDLDLRRLRVQEAAVEVVVDVLDLRVDGLRTIYEDKTSTARFGVSAAGILDVEGADTSC